MTRKIGMVLVALAAVGVTLASVSDAQAWGRRNGCGSWGGRGSHGGSFGGFFSRVRNGSHGGYGSNGSHGSHGGRVYYNGCGSHGGMYQNGGVVVEEGTESAQRIDREGDVRYYRGDASQETYRSDREMAAPAPPMDENQGRIDGERRDLDGRAEVRGDAQGEAQLDAQGRAQADGQGGAQADAQGEAEAQPSVPAPGEPDGGQAAPGTNQKPTDSNQNQNQSSNQQGTST